MNKYLKELGMGKKELKNFGITVGLIVLSIGGVLWFFDRPYYIHFSILALLLIGFGAFLPIILKPLYIIWMTFGMIMGWIMTRVILSILFFALIAPIGLLMRLFRRPMIDFRGKIMRETYWNLFSETTYDRDSYEKQY